jgi:hypothetical protein
MPILSQLVLLCYRFSYSFQFCSQDRIRTCDRYHQLWTQYLRESRWHVTLHFRGVFLSPLDYKNGDLCLTYDHPYASFLMLLALHYCKYHLSCAPIHGFPRHPNGFYCTIGSQVTAVVPQGFEPRFHGPKPCVLPIRRGDNLDF